MAQPLMVCHILKGRVRSLQDVQCLLQSFRGWRLLVGEGLLDDSGKQGGVVTANRQQSMRHWLLDLYLKKYNVLH